MQADEEATSHIMQMTAQLAQLKQMTTAEAITRNQIISAGEEAFQAWSKGLPYDEKIHAMWVQATDPKVLDKKFKEISKQVQQKHEELQQAHGVIAKHEAEKNEEPTDPTANPTPAAPITPSPVKSKKK